MAEHLLCKQGVGGSNPLVSTVKAQVRRLGFLYVLMEIADVASLNVAFRLLATSRGR